MEDLKKRLVDHKTEIEKTKAQLKLADLNKELEELQKAASSPDFWSDQAAASENMKSQAKLTARLGPWNNLSGQLEELIELADTNDKSLETDINSQLEKVEKHYAELKQERKFSGPYDDHDSYLSIYAGAGGTDAQDWAGMLLRMYTKWAEKNGFKATIIDESAGEEAGLKSVTLEISGNFVYGKLKSENGVHRLVRLSPFNSDNLRQTSFAKVEIIPKIEKQDKIEIDEKDLKVDVYRSSGKGGQSVNTTDSAVRITHIPTNITVAIQNERSQLQNKETALGILRSRLAGLQLEQHQEKISGLKGPNEQAAWGNQIRSYVLHPYKQVKDLRTGFESKEPDKVLDGDLEGLINSYLEHNLEG